MTFNVDISKEKPGFWHESAKLYLKKKKKLWQLKQLKVGILA